MSELTSSTSNVIQGDYSDLKFFKGRKVAVIWVEIPIEAADDFVKKFGTPLPDKTVPVALARLVEREQRSAALKDDLRKSVEHEKERRNWNQLSRAQQAGIACNEKGFWTFLNETYFSDPDDNAYIEDSESAAEQVRTICAVISRSQIDDNAHATRAWDNLYSNYKLWLQGVAA